MASEQWDAATGSVAGKAEETKDFGAEKKEQTKEATADVTQSAQEKAAESEQHNSNVLQNAGNKVKETLETAKENLASTNQ